MSLSDERLTEVNLKGWQLEPREEACLRRKQVAAEKRLIEACRKQRFGVCY
jgi:hypothetical protein